MKSNAVPNGLDEMLTAVLTCLEQGLDTKQTVKKRILEKIEDEYIRLDTIKKVEDFPIKLLSILQAQLGIGLEVVDGKASKGTMEPFSSLGAAGFSVLKITIPEPLARPIVQQKLQGGF